MKRKFKVFDKEDSSPKKELYEDLNLNNDNISSKCQCNPYSPFVRAGPFILGCNLGSFCDVEHYLGRKMDDPDPNRYYFIKVALLAREQKFEDYAQRQAKLLIFNEYSVLSLLKDEPGVIKIHGLYMDYIYKKLPSSQSTFKKCYDCLQELKANNLIKINSEIDIDDEYEVKNKRTANHHYFNCIYLNEIGTFYRRLILVFDSNVFSHVFLSVKSDLPYIQQKFCRYECEYENLQDFVKRYKNVPEKKALEILMKLVDIVYNLHQKNIAHRDLRLENIFYNQYNGTIILINFGLARYVINDKTLIYDLRGSSAYISPDILKRRPYNPKPSDCWALGIIFYTILFGKFPFTGDNFGDLFKKISSGLFCLPSNMKFKVENEAHLRALSTGQSVSPEAINIINSLIVTDSTKRMTINELRTKLQNTIKRRFESELKMEMKKLIDKKKCNNQELQVVPDITNSVKKIKDKKSKANKNFFENIFVNLLEQVEELYNSETPSKESDHYINHDHNYGQKSENALENQTILSFNDYLKKRHLITANQLPIPYFPLTQRFSNQFSRKKKKFFNSIFFDELCRLENGNTVPNNNVNTLNTGTKPNFTVVKVDSDIRPLSEHEFNLVNQKLKLNY